MKHSAFNTIRDYLEPMVRRPEHLQVAALCLRKGPGGPEVLLVSSLTSKRWILPKGWPMDGRSLAEAALQEAWEEAGVLGKVDPVPTGSFGYRKMMMQGLPVACQCQVFRVDVTGLSESFPEKARRKRRWLPPSEAADLVEEPGLKALLASL